MNFIKNLSINFNLNENHPKANIILIIFMMINAVFVYQFMSNGMPTYPNVDEKININIVHKLLQKETFELNYFKYPSLSFYYPKVFLDFLDFLGVDISKNFNVLFRVPFAFLLILIPLFVYKGSKNLFNNNIAIITVILYIFSPFSHVIFYYGGPDLMLFFFSSVLYYLFSLVWIEEDEKKILLFFFPLLSIIIGLSVASKYTGIIFVVMPIYLFFIKKLYKNLIWVYLFLLHLLLIVVVFFAVNPYAILNTKKLILDFLWNVKHYNSLHLGLHSNNGLAFYINNFLFHYSYFGVLLYLIGIYSLIKSNKYLLFALTIIPILLIIKLSAYTIFIERNLSPVILFYFIIAGLGLNYFFLVMEKEKSFLLKSIYILFLIFFSFFAIFNFLILFKNTFNNDGRYLSALYVNKYIPYNSTIYMNKGMYSMGYLPKIDKKNYKVSFVNSVPKVLNKDEYYIDTSYHYFRYLKREDRLFLIKGSFIKNDLAEKYLDSIKKFKKEKIFDCSIKSGNGELPTLLGVTKINECSGPKIDIYSGE